jgi:hypothetical protein
VSSCITVYLIDLRVVASSSKYVIVLISGSTRSCVVGSRTAANKHLKPFTAATAAGLCMDSSLQCVCLHVQEQHTHDTRNEYTGLSSQQHTGTLLMSSKPYAWASLS